MTARRISSDIGHRCVSDLAISLVSCMFGPALKFCSCVIFQPSLGLWRGKKLSVFYDLGL